MDDSSNKNSGGGRRGGRGKPPKRRRPPKKALARGRGLADHSPQEAGEENVKGLEMVILQREKPSADHSPQAGGENAQWGEALVRVWLPCPFIHIVLAILAFRWLIMEPYVIPSGSMIPSLLIHDHIVVNKLAYGIRYPFSERFIWQRAMPERGDVVVFRSMEDRKFMVKRVIGLPGETVFLDEGGQVWINSQKLPRSLIKNPKTAAGFYSVSERSLGASYDDYQFALEEGASGRRHRVIYRESPSYFRGETQVYEVPEGHVFVLGDNRDASRDSRSWGSLPARHIMGRAFGIFLSCEETAFSVRFLCKPNFMRWGRMFRGIK